MVTGLPGSGSAISTDGEMRPHNFDCNFLLHSKIYPGAGLPTDFSLVMDVRGARSLAKITNIFLIWKLA